MITTTSPLPPLPKNHTHTPCFNLAITDGRKTVIILAKDVSDALTRAARHASGFGFKRGRTLSCMGVAFWSCEGWDILDISSVFPAILR